MSFASFAGSLAETLGTNALSRQKEERNRQDQIREQRIKTNIDLLKTGVGIPPEHAHHLLSQVIEDSNFGNPDAAKQTHKLLGSSPEGMAKIYESIHGQPFQGGGQKDLAGEPLPAPAADQKSVSTPVPQAPASQATPQGLPSMPANPWSPEAKAGLATQGYQAHSNIDLERIKAEKEHEEKLAVQRNKEALANAAAQKQSTFETIRENARKAGTPLSPQQELVLQEQIHGVKLMAPKPAPGRSTGAQLKASGLTHDAENNPLEDDKFYKTLYDPLTREVHSAYPENAPMAARVDPFWSGPNSDQRTLRDTKTGKPIETLTGTPPSSVSGTDTSQSSSHGHYIDVGGKKTWVVDTNTSSTSRRPAGKGKSGVAGPIPSPLTQPISGESFSKPPIQPSSGRGDIVKTLNPKQELDVSKQNSTLTDTIPAFTNMLNHSDMLNSLSAAGKIKLGTAPDGLHAILTRIPGIKLSPEEVKYAADYRITTEAVNQMRSAMQAQGFRGHEGWEGLQGLKGTILGDPNVTRETLRETLKNFLSLRAANTVELAKKSGRPPVITAPIAKAYLAVYNNDPKSTESAIRADGYRLPGDK